MQMAIENAESMQYRVCRKLLYCTFMNVFIGLLSIFSHFLNVLCFFFSSVFTSMIVIIGRHAHYVSIAVSAMKDDLKLNVDQAID